MAEAVANSAPKLCDICRRSTSIYTCPRCATRTCSLPCSQGHKSAMSCTGERNKAAYVPMNKYGWGTMMDDYVFLEEMDRRVGDWGKEIVRGGFSLPRTTLGVPGYDTRSGGVQRGRGRGRGRGRAGGNPRREMLKMQLEARNIDMDLLPAGMERHKLNQSYWDSKTHTAFLTMELKIVPPRDPFSPSSQPLEAPYILLTHRNSISTPLLTLTRSIVERALSKKNSVVPTWIKRLFLPDPDDPEAFTPPHFVMAARMDPRYSIPDQSKDRGAYYRFDPTRTLSDLLRDKHFVEFPTIEVWQEFIGRVVDDEGSVTQRPMNEEPSSKRRKLTTKAGIRAINGLLSGYGSDDSEDKKLESGLGVLGEYAESDNESTGAPKEDDGEEGDGDELDSEDEVELNPLVLLELIRKAQGSAKWEENPQRDDEVDWGGSGDGEESE